MSSTLKIYMGVYLEIENKKEHKANPVYVDSRGHTVSTRFNPNTGEEHECINVDNTITIYPDSFNFNVEGFSQYEFTPIDGINKDTTIWIPNANKNFELAYFDTDEERQCIDLSDIDASELKEKFCNHYNEYLWELGEELNFNYTVKFGLISFYM
jgi:hypothetical protein